VPSIGILMTNLRNTSGPAARTVNGSFIETTRSGVPSCQPCFHSGRGGKSRGFPSIVPPSTHRLIVDISASVSRRAPANTPWPGSGGQGGITRDAVTSAICLARFLTSS
jgi:hypothetical protein